MRELTQRLLSTSIALPIAVYLLRSTPGKLLLLLIVLASSSFEFHRCVLGLYAGPGIPVPRHTDQNRRKFWLYVHVFASIIPPFAAYAFGGLVALTAGQTLVIIGILVLEIIQGVIAGHVSKEFMQEIAMGVFGHVYIDLLLGHAVLVHELVCDSGTSVLAWVITCTLVGDNGGYLFGKIAGRRKFVQAISPNKSLEGFIGALGLSAFSSWMFFLLFQRMGHPLLLNSNFANEFEFICIGIGIGFVGLFGDLFESLLKRAYAIKDIGSIFPGWGGFLDRVDALIFVFPAIYYYLVITRGYSLTFPGCSTSSFYL